MLSFGFREQLKAAAPTVRITAVLRFSPNLFAGVPGPDILERVAAGKQPILNALVSMKDVKLNSLPGLPNAVATASAHEWRALIDGNPWLAETTVVSLDENEKVATSL